MCKLAPVHGLLENWRTIRTYFGTLRPILRGHFAVLRLVQLRNGCKLAIFFVASINCILEIIKSLAALDHENLQGFHGIILFHCWTLKKENILGLGVRTLTVNQTTCPVWKHDSCVNLRTRGTDLNCLIVWEHTVENYVGIYHEKFHGNPFVLFEMIFSIVQLFHKCTTSESFCSEPLSLVTNDCDRQRNAKKKIDTCTVLTTENLSQ